MLLATSGGTPTLPATPILEYTTTRTGTHTLALTTSQAVAVTVDWGDGGAPETFNLSTGLNGVTHSYPSSASKNVVVSCAQPQRITQLQLDSQNVAGTVAVIGLQSLVSLRFASNTGLNNITFTNCAGTLVQFVANACGINQALNFSQFTFNGILNLDGNESMPVPTNLSGSFSQILLDGQMGNLDLSGVELKNNGVINVIDGNLTGITMPSYAGSVASLNLQFNASLTTIAFGSVVFSNSIVYISFTGVNSLNLSAASGTIADFRARSSALVAPPANWSNISLSSSGKVYLDNNAMSEAQVDAWATAIEARFPSAPAPLTGAIVDIGGTNAAPSAAGAAILDGLAARGATVTYT